MPNMPDPDKTHLGVRIPRELHMKLKKLAATHKLKVTDIVLQILNRETSIISLTSQDYEIIRRETKKAEERLRNNRS